MSDLGKNPCRNCGHKLTWAECKLQFARIIKAGFSVEQAKAASPRCGKCTTLRIQELRDGLA